jgi:hypothetical protein
MMKITEQIDGKSEEEMEKIAGELTGKMRSGTLEIQPLQFKKQEI